MSDTITAAENTTAQAPLLKVVRGNPDDTEIAALTLLFADLAAKAAAERAKEQCRERNLWGNPAERLSRPTTYNPTAFHNVSFY